MLNTGPITTAPLVWGFWDDPPSSIDVNATIRVFEVFTGVDLSPPGPGTTVETIDWGDLQSVTGYPGLDASMFPQGLMFVSKATALSPDISVLSDVIKGDTTGTLYPVTLLETTFQDLPAELLALNPGFGLDVSALPPFSGVSGRVVLGYADVPAGDVILFGEVVPEPHSSALTLLALGCLVGLGARRWRAFR